MPIEKLSEKEQIEVTEDSSSSEEEDFSIPLITKPVKEKKEKKERTPAQIAATKKMLETRRRNAEAKKAKAAKENDMDVSRHPTNAKPISEEEDPDDKPMTKKELKAYLASQKEAVVDNTPPVTPSGAASAVKPKRKYTKKVKPAAVEQPKVAPPNTTKAPTESCMMFV